MNVIVMNEALERFIEDFGLCPLSWK